MYAVHGLVHVGHTALCLIALTCRWCVGCTRLGPGTPAPLWSDALWDPDMASHAAAPETNSNEASPERERYQSSAGLQKQTVGLYSRIDTLAFAHGAFSLYN